MTWIEDLADRADAVLPDYVAAYYRSNAGDGSCDREGIADWNASGCGPRSCTTPPHRT